MIAAHSGSRVRGVTSPIRAEVRKLAKANGHQLDRWEVDDETRRPTAVCYCGAYVVLLGQAQWSTGGTMRPRITVLDTCPGIPIMHP